MKEAEKHKYSFRSLISVLLFGYVGYYLLYTTFSIINAEKNYESNGLLQLVVNYLTIEYSELEGFYFRLKLFIYGLTILYVWRTVLSLKHFVMPDFSIIKSFTITLIIEIVLLIVIMYEKGFEAVVECFLYFCIPTVIGSGIIASKHYNSASDD